ncbi:MAG: sulfite exporter TauE/SafE family protein [Halopseudomonas sp.]
MALSAFDLLALLIVTCGIMLQTWVGIGFGLLAAPLLYLINPAFVPGPILILGFSLSLLVVLKQHAHLSWRRIMPAIIARLPGSWCGAALLVAVPQYGLSLMFGASLMLAVLVTWRSCKITTTPWNLTIGGFFSGLIGTATSIGGPPIALVYQQQNRITARNEIAAFFLIGTPISILMLVLQDRIDQASLLFSVELLPGVLFGFWLANKLDGRINTTSAKPVLLMISTASALMVIYKGVQGWLAA